MIKRILVALDGSERAAGVFDAGVSLAERFGAYLYPFRAIEVPPEFPAAAAGSKLDPLPSLMTATAMEEMLALAAGAQARNVAVQAPLVRQGQPWRMILEAADELDADVIVVGSHGYHGLDRILGTTAGKVANLARRNVFVVHNAFVVHDREAEAPNGPHVGPSA
jgi:nucleotide-binding universal stress UspA family protein